ncbi:MAG: hypothetical protein AAF518_23275 [Spirochaetota bacterium]
MKRKQFTESQIYAILQEHEPGISILELARKYSTSENVEVFKIFWLFVN